MNLLDEIAGAKTIGIAGHERPDGDCIGSCMACALYIEKAFPDVRADVFAQELPGSLLKNIPASEKIRYNGATDIEHYDCFIVLDTGAGRLAEAEKHFESALKTINIDHHVSNPGAGDVNCIDPEASSTCEVLYRTMDPSLIDEKIARCLYIGIVTDTGVFRYNTTSAATMELAGKLMGYCKDFPDIVKEVFYAKTPVQQKVMGYVLYNSVLSLEGRLITGMITYDELQRLHAGINDIEGISSQLMLTEGTEAAVFIHGSQNGEFRVSMRSAGRVDCAAITGKLGGGVHAGAAGMTFTGDPLDMIKTIEQMVKDQLDAV